MHWLPTYNIIPTYICIWYILNELIFNIYPFSLSCVKFYKLVEMSNLKFSVIQSSIPINVLKRVLVSRKESTDCEYHKIKEISFVTGFTWLVPGVVLETSIQILKFRQKSPRLCLPDDSVNRPPPWNWVPYPPLWLSLLFLYDDRGETPSSVYDDGAMVIQIRRDEKLEGV